MAGLAISGRARGLVGRIGATERPPCDTDVKEDDEASGRTLELPFSTFVALPFGAEAEEVLRGGAGDAKLDMADPGRAGKFFAAIAAFF